MGGKCGALARGEERFEAALQRRQVRAQERGLEAFEEIGSPPTRE